LTHAASVLVCFRWVRRPNVAIVVIAAGSTIQRVRRILFFSHGRSSLRGVRTMLAGRRVEIGEISSTSAAHQNGRLRSLSGTATETRLPMKRRMVRAGEMTEKSS
jgi:hypothetical protein